MIASPTQYWIDSRPLEDPQTGGDFAACLPLDADRQAMIVGDVAGHGMAAARAAGALLQSALDAISSPAALRMILADIDDIFTHTLSSAAAPIASLFLAVSDTRTGVLDYACAGHEPALHFTTRTRHDHLGPTGPLLGLSALGPMEFRQGRVPLSADSVLVFVTDGITEARRYTNGNPQFFGSTGVARAFVEARRAHADPAVAINSAAAAYAGRLRDDATAMVVTVGSL